MADRSIPGFVSACLMLAILAALGAMTLADLFDGPGTARDERVAATPALPVTLAAARRFPGDARFYLARRYAMKDAFKAGQSRIMLSLFGRSAAPQVMTGRDGVLFLDDEAALATSLGAKGFTARQIEDWERFFAEIETDLAPEFVLLLAPNKHSVYPDKLPSWARVAPVGPLRRDAVLTAGAGLTRPPVDLARLFGEARAADPAAPLYHRTDSHWTEYGAALAVAAAFPDRAAGSPDWTGRTREGGDLARLLGLTDRLTETMPVAEEVPALACETARGAPYVPVIFDPLPEYRFTCRSAAGTGRALVFMDSYGMSAAPSLARRFAETHFVWEMAVDRDLIAGIAPDVVVLVMVERELMSVGPAELAAARVK